MAENEIFQIDHETFKCAYCSKKAERFCDFIIDYEDGITFFRDHRRFKEYNGNMNVLPTCSLPMCKEHARRKGNFDLCKHHDGMINKDKKEYPKELRQARANAQNRIIELMYQDYSERNGRGHGWKRNR